MLYGDLILSKLERKLRIKHLSIISEKHYKRDQFSPPVHRGYSYNPVKERCFYKA